MDKKMHIFEEQRRLREGISDRMLGTLTDAHDMVQDTYLKWSRADVSAIENPRSWLVAVCSRLALDVLESARVRRETYIGPWLPEPFLDEVAPDAKLRIDDTVSLVMHKRKPHGATKSSRSGSAVFPEFSSTKPDGWLSP